MSKMTLSISKQAEGYRVAFDVQGEMDITAQKQMLDALNSKGMAMAYSYYENRLKALEIHRLEERVKELYELCDEASDADQIRTYGKEIIEIQAIIKSKRNE